MPPVRVVPSLNPGKDCQSCLDVRLPDPPVNQLTLQRGKEAFRLKRVDQKGSGLPYCRYSPFNLNFANDQTSTYRIPRRGVSRHVTRRQALTYR